MILVNVCTACSALTLAPLVYAAPQGAPPAAPLAPAPSAWTLLADTTIPLRLLSTINSRTAQPGQAVYCETIFPMTVGNRILIPSGSSVKGVITQAAFERSPHFSPR